MSDERRVVPDVDGRGWNVYEDEHHLVARCTWEDDARLIAAAPELLEACEALLPYAESRAEDLDEAGAGADARAAVERARAAIAKAREGGR